MSDRDKGSAPAETGNRNTGRPESSSSGAGFVAPETRVEDEGVDERDIPRAVESRPRGKTDDPDRTL